MVGRNGVVEKEKFFSDVKRFGIKVSKLGYGKVIKNKGKNSSFVDFLGGLFYELSKGEEDIFLINKKYFKYNISSSSFFVKKIDVFDYLFCELKKCLGFSKVIVSFVVELFFKLIVDNLIIFVYGYLLKSIKRKVVLSKLVGDNMLLFLEKFRIFSFVSELKRLRINFE